MKEFKRISGNSPFFAIRDDDISYFTNPSMLETLYEYAWKLRFKISLAVIPKRGMHGANFPISRNKKLVKYLRNKIEEGSVNIVQHGYAHVNIAGKPEFAVNNSRQVDKMLVKGRKILEETFKCRIFVFTAPHDAVSRATLKSTKRNKMCLCRKFTLGRLLRVLPLKNLRIVDLKKIIIHSPNPFRTVPNSIIKITNMPIIQWNAYFSPRFGISNQTDRAKKLFIEKKEQNEPFVLLHHHWEYFTSAWKNSPKTRQLDLFNSFLDFVAKENIQKVSLSDICECFMKTC